MNPAQARHLIKDTFTQPFDRERFRLFAVNLLNRMDEGKKSSMQVPDAFAAHVKSCQRLATYADPQGELMDVLVVHLTEDYKIERTRTALRDFVAHKLKRGDNYKEAALVAFVPPDAGNWRLSYVRMQYESERDPKTGLIKPEEKITPARRFSYLVGEGESCHTAQTRFLELLQDTTTDPALAQIEEAFSVEAVTKEFFAKYVELFGDISAALETLLAKDKTIRDEFKDKNVTPVDFAKKLMGQIVFLYFLQKKGWLGVEKGKDWGAGPRNFLRRLANQSTPSDKSDIPNFFNDLLEPLFYDTLATDRGHDAWCGRFKCRIPFLNGGLFEPLADYDWKKTDILFPNRLFTNNDPVEEGITGTGVLDVFDRFNFTVNEAEPLEKEVAIDPEMLGKVFENLIEDNRRKGLGAFYTPREIVHYMCQESLINYLDTAVNDPPDLSDPSDRAARVPRAEIETFVRLGEQISHYEAVDAQYAIKMPKSIQQNAKALDDALKSITVCDPAVGSGAFPVGMMTEIVRARAALTPYFNDVAERTPYHFKRHAIQNCLYGVDIDPSAVDIAKLRLWLSLVVDEEDVKQVKPLPNLDYKIVVGNSLLGVEKDLFNQDLFQKLEKLKPLFFDQSDQSKKAALRHQINDLIHQLTHGRETFDFEIFFSEVFHAKGGFDVVIANPPYVRHETISDITPILRQRFTVGASRADLLVFFYEQGVRLLRGSGVLTLITSNKFHRAAYGSKLRPFLTDNLNIKAMVDFGDAPVFEAIAYASILIGTKGKASQRHSIHACTWPAECSFDAIEKTLAERGIEIQQTDMKADGWRIENPAAIRLLDKLRAKGTPLGEYVKGRFYRGILTGLNEAFVIDHATRDRLIAEHPSSKEIIKPFLRGRDVKRWRCAFGEQYLIKIESSENKTHLWSGKPDKEAERIFAKTYPAIHAQFETMRAALIKRYDQGKYFWELRSCDYWQEFEQPKIIVPAIQNKVNYAPDSSGYFSNDKTSIIVPDSVPLILAVLNSAVSGWMTTQTFASKQGGFFEFKPMYVSTLPIPPATAVDKARLTKLAERAEAGDAAKLRETEREIDGIVYRLFDLTPAEIAHIEKSLASVRCADANDDEGGEEHGE